MIPIVSAASVLSDISNKESQQSEQNQNEREIGWYWDGKAEKEEANRKSQPLKQIEQIKKKEDDNEINNQFSAIQQNLKHALRKAYLNPTPENIYQYKIVQDEISARANQFATLWEKMLLLHPDRDYSLDHPTSGVGLQVYHENESREKSKLIAKFAKSSGLFFFYRSTCPYCQRFAPILKNFAERYQITIIPITLDGISLPEFPDSHTDQGQAKQFHVTVEPSLFAVNPYTQKAYPIAYGLVSEDELGNHIVNIMTRYHGVAE